MMKGFRRMLGAMFLLCISQMVYAQYDYTDDVEEWTLEDFEPEEEKPKHKEYDNMLYFQYSPSQYLQEGIRHIHFQEFTLGYARSIQVVEEKPYFVEAGANVQYSHSGEHQGIDLWTLRVPADIIYKCYLSKTKDIALAPFAGARFRYMMKRASDWDRLQLGWQVGTRLYVGRLFLGVCYSRDFRDKSKHPSIHESGIQLGICF